MYSWVRTVLYTLDIVVILGMAAYIYLLHQKSRSEAAKWKRQAEQKYREGRSEASQILREAVDQISDDKNRLSAMSDRELMTEAVLGLGSLGRRMDRIEDSVRSISQFDRMLDTVNQHAEVLAENAKQLNARVLQAQDNTQAFCASVNDSGEAVSRLSDAADSVDGMLDQVSGQLSCFGGVSDSLAELESQVREAVQRLNQLLRLSMDNPSAVLGQMDSRIAAVYDQLQNMSEGLNLVAESLEGVQDTLGAVSETVRTHAEIPKTE